MAEKKVHGVMELGRDSDEKDGAEVPRHSHQVDAQDDGEEDDFKDWVINKMNSVTAVWFPSFRKAMGQCSCC